MAPDPLNGLFTPFRGGSASARGDVFFDYNPSDPGLGAFIRCLGIESAKLPEGFDAQGRIRFQSVGAFLEIFIEVAELAALSADGEETSWSRHVPPFFRLLTTIEFRHRWRHDSEVTQYRRLAKELPPQESDELTCLAIRLALGLAEADRARALIREHEFDLALQEQEVQPAVSGRCTDAAERYGNPLD